MNIQNKIYALCGFEQFMKDPQSFDYTTDSIVCDAKFTFLKVLPCAKSLMINLIASFNQENGKRTYYTRALFSQGDFLTHIP